jgi:hypothetical protein
VANCTLKACAGQSRRRHRLRPCAGKLHLPNAARLFEPSFALESDPNSYYYVKVGSIGAGRGAYELEVREGIAECSHRGSRASR